MTRPAGPAGPLLIACALGVERLALRPVPAGPAGVLRTGMGPRAAERSVARALRGEPVPGRTAVVATGFCAGLLPGMRPGDLVVAAETRDLGPPVPCHGAEGLGVALAPLGRVHTGLLAGADRVVRGSPSRAVLRASGAVAVDMESAAVLRTAVRGAPARRVAAVRVVVDAPEHELVRFGTIRGGISAFRVLRSVLPVLLDWHHNLLLPRR
ncbi:1-hydroxy-2-methyl-2-butenyl 4-diphosphate reductase [Streptomyces sp. JJ36]|uniref:phosphorylase family protein n=1 Tax=Streptomyces sp. JJ36 TaxID=2736645 RepID=UPI001F2707DD|nr:1-hydroxy-2-methyl-2-butenyl 4-diphosphate reductase [Streptomyces sp. JJ36]MCF6525861.1 1-hydroxy-2-methyl-2-butenyl 4-diphosphate reductase [Streptomyces sp. JJ36]